MYKILVNVPLTEENQQELAAVGKNCRFVCDQKEASDADIIFGNPPADGLLKQNQKLLWLQTNSAGVEPYLKEGVLPPGCKLTNATGAYGLAISEHMLSMHLSLNKKLHRYRDLQRVSRWEDLGPVSPVRGSRVLILGMGDIGGAYGKLVKAMGAYVIGLRRTDLSLPDYADEVHLTDDLDALLPTADVVAIALPGTAATGGLMNRQRIFSMKRGALLLNVGRGSIVDTDALCDALSSGQLGGAGLDVTDPEPLPEHHRLWGMENALITPHVSGGYHLDETRERIVGIFTENLKRFLAGEALLNHVDFTTGYRKK